MKKYLIALTLMVVSMVSMLATFVSAAGLDARTPYYIHQPKCPKSLLK